jgi:alkylation response protein AidB-like acyl-CoA dehydrogenase
MSSADSDQRQLAEFRQDFRVWLSGHMISAAPGEPHPRFLQRWHQHLFQAGWVGLSWPAEYGGRGLTNVHEVIVNEEIGRIGAPDAPRIGYLGRALLTWGSEEQRTAYLPGLLSGDDYWCQGFSEPGAGSDLAALSTSAVRRGQDYVVTGQKVWTSYGEFADLCLLLARTGSGTSRHKGISAFILPMRLPGIEVRPIKAITGQSEFCEVFLDGVCIPEANRIGEEGDGWPIAMMTVAYERGAADVGYLSKFGAALYELTEAVGPRLDDPVVCQEIGKLKVLYAVLGHHVERRMRLRQASASAPGPEMSVDKLLMTMVDQALHSGALRLLGPAALTESALSESALSESSPGEGAGSEWLERYLYSRAASIYGGTQQIQLNIVAQRLLGLPR